MVENKYAFVRKGMLNDFYDVLDALGATCPATQHAIKTLLMSGGRGNKSQLDDLLEARASVDRAIDLARKRQDFEAAKAKQLDALFSQGTSLTMGVCDDGQGEPPNVSPKASLCRECGGTKIDGVCQEKGCRYEALVPSGADAQTLVSIISRERAKDPTKWGSQEIATLIAKLSQQEAKQQ